MAGMPSARGTMNAEPNVVPMIDILLVLLIIFMIAQPLSRMAIDIQVPPEETATPQQDTPSNQIVLEILDGGVYQINGQRIAKAQLENQLHDIYDLRPAKMIFIKASPNRLYQEVVEAMDIARGAGVQVIGFTPEEVQ